MSQLMRHLKITERNTKICSQKSYCRTDITTQETCYKLHMLEENDLVDVTRDCAPHDIADMRR